MRIRGSAPGSGGKDRNWKSVGLAPKQEMRGWIAGDCVGVWVHQAKPSKVCVRAYRGPAHVCEKCEQGRGITWLGFLPFYPESCDLRYVCHIHDDCQAALKLLDHHDYFTLFRGHESDVGVQLRREKHQVTYKPSRHTRMQPADISDWLVTLMGLRGVLCADDLLHGAQYVTYEKTIVSAEPAVEQDKLNKRDQAAAVIGNLANAFGTISGSSNDGSVHTERDSKGRVTIHANTKNGKTH